MILEETEKLKKIINRATLKQVKFLRKYKNQQLFVDTTFVQWCVRIPAVYDLILTDGMCYEKLLICKQSAIYLPAWYQETRFA